MPTNQRGSIAIFFLIILLISIFVVGVTFLYKNGLLFRNKSAVSSEINKSSNSQSLENRISRIGKLAFTSGDSLFLIDNKRRREISKNRVNDFKWSKDGKKLGWIETKEVYPQNHNYGQPYKVGYSLKILDIASDEIHEAVKAKFDDAKVQEMWTKNLPGYSLEKFDFSADSSKIVYIYDGIWFKNLTTEKEEKLIDHKFISKGSLENSDYFDVKWNPVKDLLLLHRSIWECGATELYDLDTKRKELLRMPTCNGGFWSGDGKKIISFGGVGYGEGGLWITDLETLKTEKIVDTEKIEGEENILLSVGGVFEEGGMLFAAIEPFLLDPNKTKLELKGSNIYSLDFKGDKKAITKDKDLKTPYKFQVAVLDNGRKVTFLKYISSGNRGIYNLYLVNIDGTGEEMLLEAIKTYTWLPN